MGNVKRSMSVHPAPVVIETSGVVRPPRSYERKYDHAEGRYEEWGGEWGYRITRVTNSVDYKPGWHLSRSQVQNLIESDWTVSVLSK